MVELGAQPRHRERKDRERDQREQREPHVDPAHQRDGHHERDERVREVHDARPEEVPDRVEVDDGAYTYDARGRYYFDTGRPKEAAADLAKAVAKETRDGDYTRFFLFLARARNGERAAAAAELERCVTRLGFKGAMIHGHTQGSFLDEAKYRVIFECAEGLDVPIYLHPTLAHPDAMKSYFAGYEELARAGWGFAIDTSCHFLRLVFSGLFDAHPRLRIILGHLGEGLPFAMHRLNDHTARAAARRGLKKQPIEYLRDNLLVTTSGNWYEPAFLCTLLALGADSILFAVDWPYEANATAIEFLEKISISDADREKIAHGNAERILRM